MRMIYMSEEDDARAFAVRAAKRFAKDDKLSTYTDNEITPGCFFAVRWGMGADCVVIFKLDESFEPTNYQELIRQYT